MGPWGHGAISLLLRTCLNPGLPVRKSSPLYGVRILLDYRWARTLSTGMAALAGMAQ